jgi:hypothetical protein
VWWGYRLLFGDGLETPSDAVSFVFSGVGCAIGLILGWRVRRPAQPNR